MNGQQLQNQRVREFAAANPQIAAWLKASSSEFAESIKRRVRFGDALSDKQWAALRSAAAPAPTCDASKIEQAFEKAKGSGVKRPKLRLDEFIFSPAGEASATPGAIFVKHRETDVYLGKVLKGQFLRSRDCADGDREGILAVVADPLKAAVAYGQRTGNCAVCGRSLIVTESVDLGIGPVCRDKYF